MSGLNRLKVHAITESKLRGKALSDALAKELNSMEAPTKHDKGTKK